MNIDETLIASVVRELKKWDQTLGWFNQKNGGIRPLVGNSPADQKMIAVLEELKKRGIIKSWTGFISYSEIPAFTYASSCTLTKEFFKSNQPAKQLQLF